MKEEQETESNAALPSPWRSRIIFTSCHCLYSHCTSVTVWPTVLSSFCHSHRKTTMKNRRAQKSSVLRRDTESSPRLASCITSVVIWWLRSWWRRRSAPGGSAGTRWSSSWFVWACPGSSSSRPWPSPAGTQWERKNVWAGTSWLVTTFTTRIKTPSRPDNFSGSRHLTTGLNRMWWFWGSRSLRLFE